MELLRPKGTVEQVLDEEMRIKGFMEDLAKLKAKYRVRLDAIPMMREINLNTSDGVKLAWVNDAQIKVTTL